jgi:hypothetical protein
MLAWRHPQVKAGLRNRKQYEKNETVIPAPEDDAIYLRIVAQKARAYKLAAGSQ